MAEPVYLNPSGLLETYGVELLYATPVALADPDLRERFAAALERASGGDLRVATDAGGAGVANDALVVVDQGEVRDTGEPPTWLLHAPPESSPSQDDAAAGDSFHHELHDALAQSWWWDEAAARSHAAPYRLRLEDRRFLTLDYQRRLISFRTVLAAVLEATPCRAIVWSPCQQVVDPVEVLEGHRADPAAPLPGGLNVRFYRVDPRDRGGGDEHDELVMDTLGLGALGLIDLQCHFRGLDPEAVGEVLVRTGCYLFEHGLVVRDGDSVQGPALQDRWLARKAVALAPPEREVLELDPGFPFAAVDEPA